MAEKKQPNLWERLSAAPALLAAGLVSGNPRLIGGAINPNTYFGGSAAPTSNRPTTGRKVSTGGMGGGYPVEETMEEYLQRVMNIMSSLGVDSGTASRIASSGGGFGGGGGGGGAIAAANNAARDLALSNSASTYASAAATFDGSPEEYRKIHGEERGTTEGATKGATEGAQQSYDAAVAKRALERKALGIEDAAAVVSDTVETEKKIADENITRNDARMSTRAQGHLDNNLKFNTDLKAVVELEGKEKQKQIADYYAGQLAQIAARSSGGRRSGGSRSSGGGSSKGLTPGQLWNAARDLQGDDLRRLDSMYGPKYRTQMMRNTQTAYPKATLNQVLSTTKYVSGKGPYGR